MPISFLIEFRLRGYAKRYARWARTLIHREARRLKIGELGQQKFVPHITLFGRAETYNLQNVIHKAHSIGRKYTLVPFKLSGFDGFQNPDANWLYLNVYPSSDLEQLRYGLAQSLLRSERRISDTCQPYDHKLKYVFHCAIGKFEPRDSNAFKSLLDYANTKCSLETFKQSEASFFAGLLHIIRKYVFKEKEDYPPISQQLLRITILGQRGRIQCEYDLVLKRVLSRTEALSSFWWRKTIETLRGLRGVLQEGRLPTPINRVYFIGDTHFDHKNIIKYCRRPFLNVREMNQAIKDNWNNTVGENDAVYFLGDWAFGWRHKPIRYWQSQLKGVKLCIQGSHDPRMFEKARVLNVGGYSFLLIHDPKEKNKWDGWIIHGHVHNNRMDRYPFINGERKTINVSSELINYKPVSLSYLLSLNLDSIKRMRTIDSLPERW